MTTNDLQARINELEIEQVEVKTLLQVSRALNTAHNENL